MSPAQRRAYRRERDLARGAGRAEVDVAWAHLERAHILAQPFPVAHTGSHLAQLGLAVRVRDPREVLGQVVRIAVAGPASLVGRVPVGNSGRARMPLRATAAVPEDLAALLADDTGRN